MAIPKFWYKWTKTGDALKLQISPDPVEGFFVSPAHMERGDGKGERDVVYIGRYHCDSTYKSTTNQIPKVNIYFYTALTSISKLGSNIWLSDFAMRSTIWMLYLVEYADWNSQGTIGSGCGNGRSAEKVGASDSMPYHTGTMQGARTAYGVGVQYRYIEGLWDNVFDFTAGIKFYNTIRVTMNPADFNNIDKFIPICPFFNGYPSAIEVADASGLEWVIYPTAAGGSDDTYVSDEWRCSSGADIAAFGGYYFNWQVTGLFCAFGFGSAGADGFIGCRLMKLPDPA